jgi:hypothetical protein
MQDTVHFVIQQKVGAAMTGTGLLTSMLMWLATNKDAITALVSIFGLILTIIGTSMMVYYRHKEHVMRTKEHAQTMRRHKNAP